MFAGVDHGCWSCIFKFRIQATVASTTGEKCFVCYTEYNTHGIHENIEICVVLVHNAKIMENTLRHEGQNTCAVSMKSMILWNFVSWCLGAYFQHTFCYTAGCAPNCAQKGTPRECNEFEYKWGSGNHTETNAQEEDQREVACTAQLVRVDPLMQEVPGSIPSVLGSTKFM